MRVAGLGARSGTPGSWGLATARREGGEVRVGMTVREDGKELAVLFMVAVCVVWRCIVDRVFHGGTVSHLFYYLKKIRRQDML